MTVQNFNFKRELHNKEMIDLGADTFIPLAKKGGYHVFNSKYNDLLYLFDKSALKVVELETSVDLTVDAHLSCLVQAYQQHTFLLPN